MPFNLLRQSAVLFVLLVVGVVGESVAQDVAQAAPQSGATPPASYANYTVPARCARLAPRLEHQRERALRPDTIPYVPFGRNPYAPDIVDAVRQCVAKFSIETIPERDLLWLAEAYLAANDDARATAALRRASAVWAHLPIPQRAWRLATVVDVYAFARPARLHAADSILTILDALGAPAAMARLMAHGTMTRLAAWADSDAMIAPHARTAIAAAAQMVGEERHQRAMDEATVRYALGTWYARHELFDSARALARETRTTIAPLNPAMSYGLEQYEKYQDWVGTPAKPMVAEKWYDNPTNASYPRKGKPTLILLVGHWCADYCYPGYAVVRRLQRKYGDKLDVVLSSRTFGFYRNKLRDSTEEMNLADTYFRDYLKLQTPMGMVVTRYTIRDDGVMMEDQTPDNIAYGMAWEFASLNLAFVVVDDKGRIRMGGGLTPQKEAQVDHLIGEIQSQEAIQLQRKAAH